MWDVRAGEGAILFMLNKVMDDIIRIIKPLENSGVLIDWANKTVKHEIKKQEGILLGMLLRTSLASMLVHMLTGKGVMESGKGVMRAGRGCNDMHQMDKKISIPLHPVSNIKVAKYFNYKLWFNGIYSRDILPRIKDGAYVINLDDKQSKRTHCVTLRINTNTAVYFDSFGTGYIF